jgi:hypothetical protein
VEYRGGVNRGRVPPHIGRMRRSCLWGATCPLVQRAKLSTDVLAQLQCDWAKKPMIQRPWGRRTPTPCLQYCAEEGIRSMAVLPTGKT